MGALAVSLAMFYYFTLSDPHPLFLLGVLANAALVAVAMRRRPRSQPWWLTTLAIVQATACVISLLWWQRPTDTQGLGLLLIAVLSSLASIAAATFIPPSEN